MPQLVVAQATSITVGGSTSALSATYNTVIAVDPNLTITANGTITGFRVQISQTYTTGDLLGYTGALPAGVTQSWNATTGVLSFNGTTTAENWQTLLRTVTFRSTTSTCYANQRRVTFVAGTVYYNPLTAHFYEYVAGNTSWTNAYTVSAAKSYFGRNLKNINITEKNWFHNPIKNTPVSFEYYYDKYVSKNFNGHEPHSHALYQYYRMYIDYLMLKNYQEDSNQTYDYFVRVRLDARIMQDLNLVFDYLEKTEKLIFIEHEQLMIVKPELENVFNLIEYYGTYEEPVQNKYVIYL
jgi:hypothetical protein